MRRNVQEKKAGRWDPSTDAQHLRKWLQKGVVLQDGEGSINLEDEDPIHVAIYVAVEGYGPHTGAIFVDQNRYHATPDTALQGAAEVFSEWRLNSDFYADHIKELQEEWGDKWMEILEETDDAVTWTLSPAEAAEAIRGTDAEKFIDIYDPAAEDREASVKKTAQDEPLPIANTAGVWGHGPLDSDEALDMMAELEDTASPERGLQLLRLWFGDENPRVRYRALGLWEHVLKTGPEEWRQAFDTIRSEVAAAAQTLHPEYFPPQYVSWWRKGKGGSENKSWKGFPASPFDPVSDPEQVDNQEASVKKTAQDEPLPIANPADTTDRRGNLRRLLQYGFGAYGEDKVLVWATGFTDSFNEAVQWLYEKDPQHETLMTDEELHSDKGLREEAMRELGPDATEEQIMEYMESDLTYSDGIWVNDWTVDEIYDDSLISETLRRSKAESEKDWWEASTARHACGCGRPASPFDPVSDPEQVDNQEASVKKTALLNEPTKDMLNRIYQDDQLEQRVFETLVDIAEEADLVVAPEMEGFEYAEGVVWLSKELQNLGTELPELFPGVNLQKVDWIELAQAYVDQNGEAAFYTARDRLVGAKTARRNCGCGRGKPAALNPAAKEMQALQDALQAGDISPEEFEARLEELEARSRHRNSAIEPADVVLLQNAVTQLGKTKDPGEIAALLRDLADAAGEILQELRSAQTKTAAPRRYYHCETFTDCLMQTVESNLTEYEIRELSKDRERAEQLLEGAPPEAVDYLMKNAEALIDAAYQEKHDKLLEAVEAAKQKWLVKWNAAVDRYLAANKDIPPGEKELAAELLKDEEDGAFWAMMEEAGHGVGASDCESGHWGELCELGINGAEDILKLMPRDFTLDEDVYNESYIVPERAAELARQAVQ